MSMIKLYTQDNCGYCDILKKKLDEWGIKYSTLNISHDQSAKEYVKKRNHRVVPILYLDEFWVNKDIDTKEFTEKMFYDRLDVFIETMTPEELALYVEKHENGESV